MNKKSKLPSSTFDSHPQRRLPRLFRFGQPPTGPLFGENVWQNERIGDGGATPRPSTDP